MAVLISNGPTNLSAANGFLKAELYNLGLFGNVSGALSTPATISATFPTGSRNNSGIILAVMPALGYANIDRSVKASLQQIMETCTAAVSNHRITFVAHGFSANQPVMFSNSGGSLPGGLSGNTIYYVKTVVDADSFTMSTTAGGATLDITSNGTGTQTLYAERGAARSLRNNSWTTTASSFRLPTIPTTTRLLWPSRGRGTPLTRPGESGASMSFKPAGRRETTPKSPASRQRRPPTRTRSSVLQTARSRLTGASRSGASKGTVTQTTP